MAPKYFQTLARYNQWANGQLYGACARLGSAEYHKPRQAFFGSIHGTLNHILVGDRVWLSRIERTEHGIKALNQILYDDFDSLRRAREAEDAHIVTLVDGLDEGALGSQIAYRTLSGGAAQETQLEWILAHFFNHGTHHRGQVHDMLSQTDVSPPELDLIFYLRVAARG